MKLQLYISWGKVIPNLRRLNQVLPKWRHQNFGQFLQFCFGSSIYCLTKKILYKNTLSTGGKNMWNLRGKHKSSATNSTTHMLPDYRKLNWFCLLLKLKYLETLWGIWDNQIRRLLLDFYHSWNFQYFSYLDDFCTF